MRQTVDEGYAAAKGAATWECLDAWANTRERLVVRRKDLPRMWDFTTKLLLVRRVADGELAGCALLSEAPEQTNVCDTLHSHRNPSLPMVKTARMNDNFRPIQPAHVRCIFGRALGSLPIDELVLICGERGVGSAVMAHLHRREPRILDASVVPGSERVTHFYDKFFRPLPFERKDGEQPYAACIGAGAE